MNESWIPTKSSQQKGGPCRGPISTCGCKIFEKKNCNNEIYKLDHDLKRASDTFSYELDSKPLSVTIDPNVQTVDLDYRNNTTKMRNTIIFDWPGLYYNPRDQYVYRWSPQFYYNESKSDLLSTCISYVNKAYDLGFDALLNKHSEVFLVSNC